MQELAVSIAMAYLSYYVANSPLGVSGVTAVVVLGLYGSATGKWEMCDIPSCSRSPHLPLQHAYGQEIETLVSWVGRTCCVCIQRNFLHYFIYFHTYFHTMKTIYKAIFAGPCVSKTAAI